MSIDSEHQRLPYPPKDAKEFEIFLKALREKRNRYRYHPTKKGTRLFTRDFSSFDYLGSSIYTIPPQHEGLPQYQGLQFADLKDSLVPNLVYRDKSQALGALDPSSTIVNLIERLTPEYGALSQVWIAQVNDIHELAVVKIFQECLLDEDPCWLSGQIMGFCPEDELSHREAWAYHNLGHLQGSMIPHSYGFYDVTMPSGDISCMHILERLNGMTLENYLERWECRSRDQRSVYEALAAGTMQVIMASRRAGVLHRDLMQNNFMVLDSRDSGGLPTSRPEVVLLDFGFARSSSKLGDIPGSPWTAAKVLNIDQRRAYHLSVSILGKEQALEWTRETFQKRQGEGKVDEFESSFWLDMIYQHIPFSQR